MSAVTFGSAPLVAPVCKATASFAPNAYAYRDFFNGLRIARVTRDAPVYMYHDLGPVYRKLEKALGQGANGTVYEYVLQDNSRDVVVPARFALKVTTDPAEAEAIAHIDSRPSLRARFACTQIGASQGMSLVAMPMYDGDLTTLARDNSFSDSEVLNIALQYLDTVRTLMSEGLCYLDFKPENCLYFACGDPAATVHVSLGDFGSIQSVDAKEQAASLPPPEYPTTTNVANHFPDNARAVMFWACGVTLLSLAAPHKIRNFYWDDVEALYTKLVADSGGDRVLSKQVLRRMLVHSAQAAIPGRPKLAEALRDLMGTSAAASSLTIDEVIARFKAYETQIDTQKSLPRRVFSWARGSLQH